MNGLDKNVIREELARALSRTFDDNKKIAVYGAGDTAERAVVPLMEEEGFSPEYFIDDTPSKQGKLFHGIPIISFKEAHTRCRSFLILICSVIPGTRSIMKNALNADPIENTEIRILDEYVFQKHASDVLAVLDMLEDDLSKATYANIIQARMGFTKQDYSLTQRDHQYFGIPEFMAGFFCETFVDCGAYVGDTIEHYLVERGGLFQKIVAFEPCNKTFNALQARMNRVKREWEISEEKIELVCAGLGRAKCRIGAQDTSKPVFEDSRFDLLNRPEVETGGIQICSIDDYFANEPVSFIKADIEGFETPMLEGAVNVIRRDRPKLAICMYHSSTDM